MLQQFTVSLALFRGVDAVYFGIGKTIRQLDDDRRSVRILSQVCLVFRTEGQSDVHTDPREAVHP